MFYIIQSFIEIKIKSNTKIIWLGNNPILEQYEKTKKGKIKWQE